MKLREFLMIKAAYSKQRERHMESFLPPDLSKPASSAIADANDDPMPTKPPFDDTYHGHPAFYLMEMADRAERREHEYQNKIRQWHYRQTPEGKKARQQARMVNPVVGALGVGGIGLASAEYLNRLYGLKGWKKWLTRAGLGLGGAALGTWLGSGAEPVLPQEYEDTYYRADGTPYAGPLAPTRKNVRINR